MSARSADARGDVTRDVSIGSGRRFGPVVGSAEDLESQIGRYDPAASTSAFYFGAEGAIAAAPGAIVCPECAAVVVGAALVSTYDRTRRLWVTYSMAGPDGVMYYGRTSGFMDPASLVRPCGYGHVRLRWAGFGMPVVDRYAQGHQGYLAIRGREQQLIDYSGTVGSPFVRNRIRAVARNNLEGPTFHQESNLAFGPLAPTQGITNMADPSPDRNEDDHPAIAAMFIYCKYMSKLGVGRSEPLQRQTLVKARGFGRSGVRGCIMSLRDIISRSDDWPGGLQREYFDEIKQITGKSIFDIAGDPAKFTRRVIKRDKIKNDEEHYFLRELLEVGRLDEDEAQKLLEIFERYALGQ